MPLSDEQIANWRKALIGLFGPYALIMPKDQIQAYRDRLQAKLGEGATVRKILLEGSDDPE